MSKTLDELKSPWEKLHYICSNGITEDPIERDNILYDLNKDLKNEISMSKGHYWYTKIREGRLCFCFGGEGAGLGVPITLIPKLENLKEFYKSFKRIIEKKKDGL